MTIEKAGGKSFIGGFVDDFRSLSAIQIISIIAAIAIALILEVVGFGRSCMGFLIIAVVLYMIPHFLKVMSVRVKAVTGIVFIVIAVLIGTFSYTDMPNQTADYINHEHDEFRNMSITEENGIYTLHYQVNPTAAGVENWDVKIIYGDVGMISFGYAGNVTSTHEKKIASSDLTQIEGTDWYEGTLTLSDMAHGKYEYIAIGIENISDSNNVKIAKSVGFTYDTGISSSDVTKLCLYGSGYVVALSSIMFFIILIFSALMRSSAMKTRAQMEADGRLYPQGYGRCKKCGAVVLPGEVVCRKCGEYIEVPEEMKPKKADFFTCSECGAEVPSDATVCPKCGSKFDEEDETEVEHPDGTVDVSSENVICPHCGQSIPSNADWCPKCGKKTKE